ncbi:MAG: hypothetical protein K6G60_00170 [Lachnospiraceae bacterium]|nr:hypothetical protein [Lachnospiraceae bacterium]
MLKPLSGPRDEIMLIATEHNWGLHSTNDWDRITWTICYNGRYNVKTYYVGSEKPFRRAVEGDLDKEVVIKLKSILDTKILRKNPPVDACDGVAWEIEYFTPGGERLNYSGKPDYIYGETTLEQIVALLPKEGVYEACEVEK